MYASALPSFLRLLAGLMLMAMLSVSAAAAQDQDARAAALDKLFAELRVAADPGTAQVVADQIWIIWTTPSDPDLARRMREAMDLRRYGDYRNAVRLLTDIISEHPEYSEAWNQRATLHFLMGNLDDSIEDCGKVLELEPRHFGALAGRAVIYLQLGDRALALKDITTALEIHPFLNERHLFPELQRDVTRI